MSAVRSGRWLSIERVVRTDSWLLSVVRRRLCIEGKGWTWLWGLDGRRQGGRVVLHFYLAVVAAIVFFFSLHITCNDK